MITKTFYLGGNNNHVDGSPPTRQRGSKFWYIVIWKDLETVSAAFDRPQDNVSIFRHASPDCKKGACQKMCSSCLYPAPSRLPPKARMCPGGTIQTKHFIHDVNQRCGADNEVTQRNWVLRSSRTRSISRRGAFTNSALSQICHGLTGVKWWRQTGSNRRPEACKATALPTELCPHVDIPIAHRDPPASNYGGPRRT